MTEKLIARHAFSGSQTEATYLGRIESGEPFEVQTTEHAEYLIRNGFARRPSETEADALAPAPIEEPKPKLRKKTTRTKHVVKKKTAVKAKKKPTHAKTTSKKTAKPHKGKRR